MVVRMPIQGLGLGLSAGGRSILEASIDDIAAMLERHPDPDYAALVLSKIYDGDTIANVLSSTKLSVDKAVAIISSPKMPADTIQAALYRMAELLHVNRLVDIMTYNADSVTLTANATYTGVNVFNTLDLGGFVYTADGQPHVIVANVIKDTVGGGQIVKTATGGAGGAAPLPPGAGGAGGGGLIILAKTVELPSSSLSADGEAGEDGGTTASTIGGSAGSGGSMIVVAGDSPGNGGYGGGRDGNSIGGTPGGGGGGGGSGNIGGRGGTISLIQYTSLKEIATLVMKPIIDWWLVNVVGKTPTNTTAIPNIYGAGGGGGSEYGGIYDGGDGGGGGGSGGEIIIVADSVVVNSITARGGSGGNGGSYGSFDGAGGGGGGGIVYVAYKTSATITTVDVSGGAGGTGDYNGGAGTPGTYRIEQLV